MRDFFTTATTNLSSDPRISAFRVVFEASHTAEVIPHVFIVAENNWLAGERARVETEKSDDSLRMWSYVFDAAYAKTLTALNGPDFSGWTSSFTGDPIPVHDMEEWRDHTIERILALSPRRVIEIGCGLGLLIEKLAAHCLSYQGLEASAAAVRFVHAWTTEQPGLQHVAVQHRGAGQIGTYPHASADLVIINSVAQYFPSAGYLRHVLAETRPILMPGGHVFIGDVRDYRLLPVFDAAVALARAASDDTVGYLKRSLRNKTDRELSVAPQFFSGLEFYTTLRVLLKDSASNTEMTNYRYDVILRESSQSSAADAVPEPMMWRDCGSLTDFLRQESAAQGPILVRGIENQRLAYDRIAAKLIALADPTTAISVLRAQIADQATRCGRSWNPSEIVQEAQTLGYRAEALCSADPFQFDLLLSDPGRPAPMIGWAMPPQETMATDPILTEIAEDLVFDLEQMLQQNAGPAQPVHISVVPELPLL